MLCPPLWPKEAPAFLLPKSAASTRFAEIKTQSGQIEYEDMLDPNVFCTEPGSIIAEDDLRSVEQAVIFRWLLCYKCDHAAVYRLRVLQVRRHPEPPLAPDGLLSEERVASWRSIPRFAEIAETVKCNHCGEVLGAYPLLIY